MYFENRQFKKNLNPLPPLWVRQCHSRFHCKVHKCGTTAVSVIIGGREREAGSAVLKVPLKP